MELDFKNVMTRDGREVVIHTINGKNEKYPVVGEVKTGIRWDASSWTKDGLYNLKYADSGYNLIPRPKRIQGWINIYPKYGARMGMVSAVHLTREEADQMAHKNRIACIHIDIEEGEGLGVSDEQV